MLTNSAPILIAEGHTLVAELWRNLLTPEFEIVGIVADGAATGHARSTQADNGTTSA